MWAKNALYATIACAYKNNACALLLRILNILNSAACTECTVRGVYECRLIMSVPNTCVDCVTKRRIRIAMYSLRKRIRVRARGELGKRIQKSKGKSH